VGEGGRAKTEFVEMKAFELLVCAPCGSACYVCFQTPPPPPCPPTHPPLLTSLSGYDVSRLSWCVEPSLCPGISLSFPTLPALVDTTASS
jgi:hypothetical protein